MLSEECGGARWIFKKNLVAWCANECCREANLGWREWWMRPLNMAVDTHSQQGRLFSFSRRSKFSSESSARMTISTVLVMFSFIHISHAFYSHLVKCWQFFCNNDEESNVWSDGCFSFFMMDFVRLKQFCFSKITTSVSKDIEHPRWD